MLTFHQWRRLRFLWLFIVLAVVSVIALTLVAASVQPAPRNDIIFGVTFSQKYAIELGLDWRAAYLATIHDLGVRSIRIPAYWDILEPYEDYNSFQDLDWQIEQAESQNARLIIAVGRRLPRWPECHIPQWALDFSEEEQQKRVLNLISQIIIRYREAPAVLAWQIENEPFLDAFGICPPFDEKFFASEINLVRSLDPSREIIVTESGELSSWLHAAQYADTVGVSMYRITWNDVWGYFYYPLPPAFYTFKASMVESIGRRTMVSEMQAEPWATRPLAVTSLDDQFVSMNVEIFSKNIDFIRRTQLSEVYLWGVEWWYWLREQGIGDMWEAGRALF